MKKIDGYAQQANEIILKDGQYILYPDNKKGRGHILSRSIYVGPEISRIVARHHSYVRLGTDMLLMRSSLDFVLDGGTIQFGGMRENISAWVHVCIGSYGGRIVIRESDSDTGSIFIIVSTKNISNHAVVEVIWRDVRKLIMTYDPVVNLTIIGNSKNGVDFGEAGTFVRMQDDPLGILLRGDLQPAPTIRNFPVYHVIACPEDDEDDISIQPVFSSCAYM
ncbi:hypothetical protein [Novacetimonas pomaceti]|uniref:hypothetical protein n=1 Tax=Novacetimonas pomaceti TaxID=2021998 RepID=UPI001057FB28|nr:hypothetical protein [Novacetimonas pomaceti]